MSGLFRTPTPVNEPVRSYGAGSSEKTALKAELERSKQDLVDVPLVIGGNVVRTEAKQDHVIPHHHKQKIATSSVAGREEATKAIDAALKARKDWARLPWAERAGVFLKAADLLATKYRNAMNAATMHGQSKTAYQSEIDAVCELCDFFRFNAHYAERIHGEQPISSPGIWNRLSARPLEGFVYAVTPFNFSSISINLAAAPALMGCAVIWKPAPGCTLSSWLGMQILEEAGLPPGVINFLPGDAQQISDVVLNHPELAGIHFTGSTQVFNHLWKTVGSQIDRYRTYPRIVGETGGKDFVFAHTSADVDMLVTALIRGAFEYQGQKCSAASRAYIPKSIWPKVREKLVALTEEIKMGDVEDFTNFMGAVIDKKAFDKISGYIERCKTTNGAHIIAGGKVDDKEGYFIRPTIVETTDPNFVTMREEIFGPVLTVYPYDDQKFEEVLDLCDQTSPYALTGAIFARDRQVIHHMAMRLENAAGNFYINDKPTGAVVGQQPFGGARASGTNDKAGSIYNLLRWVSHRTIKENFQPIVDYRYPYMEES
jgi:1-pyrroline-5-carboxylate dehydrogenase